MAITSSAKKAYRASQKKHVFNLRRSRAMKEAIKTAHKEVFTGKAKGADAALSAAFQAIDKAAKRGVIKKNTAARKKSRLVAALKRKAR
jgi:small subunit ribosomal protein S20